MEMLPCSNSHYLGNRASAKLCIHLSRIVKDEFGGLHHYELRYAVYKDY
jgi:hypothetical protein